MSGENGGKCLKCAKDIYEQRVNLHVTWHIQRMSGQVAWRREAEEERTEIKTEAEKPLKDITFDRHGVKIS